MKQGFVRAALAALTLGVALASPAHAQGKSIAVMPTLFFSADPASADNVTNGLVQQFEGQGYSVTPMDKSKSAFQAAGLQPSRHYADSERSMSSEALVTPSSTGSAVKRFATFCSTCRFCPRIGTDRPAHQAAARCHQSGRPSLRSI